MVEDDNIISHVEVLQLVCNENSSLVCQKLTDATVKQVVPHMGINSRQWIIQ
jgi:hypothetical protein